MKVEHFVYRTLAWAVLAAAPVSVAVPPTGTPATVHRTAHASTPAADPAGLRQAVIDAVTTGVVQAGVALSAADAASPTVTRTTLLDAARIRLDAAAAALTPPLDGVPDPARTDARAALVKASSAVQATLACQGATPAASCRDANIVAAQVEDARAAGAAVAALRPYGSLTDTQVAALVAAEKSRLTGPSGAPTTPASSTP